MFTIKGKYDEATVFATNIEEEAISQIYTILNHSVSENAHTRIMADAHAGKGCVIGYTAKVTDKVIPNLIGVDIGCGVSGVCLVNAIDDLAEFDAKAHNYIPTGMSVYSSKRFIDSDNWDEKVYSFAYKNGIEEDFFDSLKEICERTNQDYNRVISSIGTLGGGNHFCEAGIDKNGKYWFFVHSGSRNFGLRVAEYWQDKAYRELNSHKEEIEFIKKNFVGKEIEERIKALPKETKELSYLTGENVVGYLHDSEIAQKYAELNRKMIIHRMFSEDEIDTFVQSTHNYIDVENKIIRKGAISAYEGEKVIIPLNMRDGCIFGIGKGNEEFNCSAPHGAGRKMSRSKAKAHITLEEFSKSMKGIFSTCIVKSTIDESPMAYKSKDDIIDNIKDTVEIKEIIKPIWNFKAT